ncbi:MAG: HU family DNA-binding protein [Candidatus Riflebacteria bacterium]|nr:HU family DNA-binding protein [Candidatus Riflebacteria bacterium]
MARHPLTTHDQNDLVKKIAKKFKLSLHLTSKITQTLLDEIINGLISDSRTELRRFGVFTIKKQKPRKITLPTGAEMTRPAKKILLFKPSPPSRKNSTPKRRAINTQNELNFCLSFAGSSLFSLLEFLIELSS